ncbi:Uu.00g024680.m01.CDS01 [Anthostomella pinea]|uniref:Uu.00g024680.m01.CDS01 n=1 Tax=Anthostomella pinea TaxID=933095 RepID=A0AAI8V869_9PEZI|nr:Uu.00g024680.m01.CDS01 [Anthostomella pinea]
MKSYIIVAAAALTSVAAATEGAPAAPSLMYGNTSHLLGANSSGIPPCDALTDAGLGDRLLFATDADYEPQIATWWAENARKRPYCLVMPQSSEEVSTALTALVNVNDGAGDWHIAVRSGGHSSTGSSSIANGVIIDLSNMNTSTYDAEANVAKIQPGARWNKAYAELDKEGVTVAGGRDGGVGVGGFLLGGGISYYSGRMGFGCDTVVNFEVVLADGAIVNANETANADLWRALKGGGSNFGIVTRYDMEAIPAQDLYYDSRLLSSVYSDAVVDAAVGFADQDQSLADNHLITFFSHDTSTSPDIHAATIYVNTQGNGSVETAFDKVQDLPALYNTTVVQSMAEAANGSQVAAGSRAAGATLLFRSDPQILRRAAEIHAEFVESLKGFMTADEFVTMWFFQPIPSYMSAISQQRGGDMLGLDEVRQNAIMWTGGAWVNTDDAAFARAQAELGKATARVKEASRSMNGDIDFIYLNYADASQDSLGSYGPANVEHMREVAARYDPTEVFQLRVPGGFKISSVA